MNIQNLLNSLHAQVDATDDPLELLMLSKAIQRLNVGQVSVVATFAALPSAPTKTGELYFVTADESLYYSDGIGWKNITARLGFAFVWGAGTNGRLGDGTIVNKSSPVSVAGGFTDWCQVFASDGHSLGIRTNGTAWAWGCDSVGQLGDNSTVDKCSPVSVVGGFTDWCQVSAGAHSLAVRKNGTAWAWGLNADGRLGDGTTIARSSPVLVAGGFTDWRQVGAGAFHSLGVRTNGTAWAWGDNFCGTLGDGTTVNKSSPVLVAGGFTDWCQVSGTIDHSLGVRSNGTAWAWGSNGSGRLGDGTTVNKSSPVSVVGGFTDWCQVSAGTSHSLGLRSNGTAWAWGNNICGRLGDGTIVSKLSPILVAGGFTNWCQVSAGLYHSIGVRTNGTAWAWGYNVCGRLGDGTVVNRSSPVSVVGGFLDWCQVSGGNRHSLGLRSPQ